MSVHSLYFTFILFTELLSIAKMFLLIGHQKINNLTRLNLKVKETDPDFDEEQLELQLWLSLAKLGSN